MLSSGAYVIIWDKMLSSGANIIIVSSGANVILWCYHVMLSSGMITHPFFIFPENFTHSLERVLLEKMQSCFVFLKVKSYISYIYIPYIIYIHAVLLISTEKGKAADSEKKE
jgi:hypothetical protein